MGMLMGAAGHMVLSSHPSLTPSPRAVGLLCTPQLSQQPAQRPESDTSNKQSRCLTPRLRHSPDLRAGQETLPRVSHKAESWENNPPAQQPCLERGKQHTALLQAGWALEHCIALCLLPRLCFAHAVLRHATDSSAHTNPRVLSPVLNPRIPCGFSPCLAQAGHPQTAAQTLPQRRD